MSGWGGLGGIYLSKFSRLRNDIRLIESESIVITPAAKCNQEYPPLPSPDTTVHLAQNGVRSKRLIYVVTFRLQSKYRFVKWWIEVCLHLDTRVSMFSFFILFTSIIA